MLLFFFFYFSRSSTATVTIGTPCWEHTCDRHSISSSSDSSGWSQAVTKPPARPPKPGTTSPNMKKPAAPPPQSSYDNYDIPKIPYPVVSCLISAKVLSRFSIAPYTQSSHKSIIYCLILLVYFPIFSSYLLLLFNEYHSTILTHTLQCYLDPCPF